MSIRLLILIILIMSFLPLNPGTLADPGAAPRKPAEKDSAAYREDPPLYRDDSIGPPPAPTGVYPDPGCDGDKIIVDKNKNILYLYKNGDLARMYRVATGERPEYTPEGKFTVMNKYSIPSDPGKERFGPRWLGIGVPSEKDLRSQEPDQRAPRGIKYGIHGTDEPESIGTYASGGCVRLSNEDILELYELVDVNTPVEIIR